MAYRERRLRPEHDWLDDVIFFGVMAFLVGLSIFCGWGVYEASKFIFNHI